MLIQINELVLCDEYILYAFQIINQLVDYFCSKLNPHDELNV